ncbi:unnamed protein product [Anisakis simplex]|uniref:Histidine-rich glycoprotein n=1 Tax=Anisakis simplex TaxID=6269 RepID=A0A0M3K4B6_ANISI|nr:unnamed protein product [Anisakis simplex]
MQSICLVILLCLISSLSAYSPLRKYASIRTDHFDDEDSLKTEDDEVLKRVVADKSDSEKDAQSEHSLSTGQQPVKTNENDGVVNLEIKKSRQKRQFHYHPHSGEHFHYDIPSPHSPFDFIHADVHHNPNPLLTHAHYRIQDPYSPGHYHANVHYHVDPYSGGLYPHAQMVYHPFKAKK